MCVCVRVCESCVRPSCSMEAMQQDERVVQVRPNLNHSRVHAEAARWEGVPFHCGKASNWLDPKQIQKICTTLFV